MSNGSFLGDLPSHIRVVNGSTGPAPLTGIPFLIGDVAGDTDVILDSNFEVVEVVVRKDGAGTGNTVQVKNVATAITDAIAAAVDKAVTRAGTIDAGSARNVVLAGTALRVTATKAAGSMACLVTVMGFVR